MAPAPGSTPPAVSSGVRTARESPTQSESGDRFGEALSAGDFNGEEIDAADDLAVGVPGEGVGAAAGAGAVNVIYGFFSSGGLNSFDNQRWTQDAAGIVDSAEASDGFGSSLTSGDFEGDGADDLAVGVPFENLGTIENAGIASVIYGANSGGLSSTGNEKWSQESSGIPDPAEQDDEFANVLGAGDFDADGVDDLAVGVPFEDVGSVFDGGAVNVIYGTVASGLGSTSDDIWHQDRPGILDTAETNDHFGASLTAGDFNGTDPEGADDLAVGVPNEGLGTVQAAGAVNVIYGFFSVGGLDDFDNQKWSQATSGIADSAEVDDQLGLTVPGASGDFPL